MMIQIVKKKKTTLKNTELATKRFLPNANKKTDCKLEKVKETEEGDEEEQEEEEYESEDIVIFCKPDYNEYHKKHLNQFENDSDFENESIQGELKNITMSPMKIQIGCFEDNEQNSNQR